MLVFWRSDVFILYLVMILGLVLPPFGNMIVTITSGPVLYYPKKFSHFSYYYPCLDVPRQAGSIYMVLGTSYIYIGNPNIKASEVRGIRGGSGTSTCI